MKIITLFVTVLIFLVVTSGPAAAFWGIKKTTPKPSEKASPSAAAESALVGIKRQEAKAREALGSKDWMIYLTPVNGGNSDTDVLTFSVGKFSLNDASW